jgi:hypothetical protein
MKLPCEGEFPPSGSAPQLNGKSACPGFIDIDYYEQLLEIKGFALVQGQRIPIEGLGKLGLNWNRW